MPLFSLYASVYGLLVVKNNIKNLKNNVMSNSTINFLKQHGIRVKFENRRVLAFDEYTFNGDLSGDWVDCTNWTVTEARNFLGY